MIARRRITGITEQIAGGLPAAFSAMRTAAGRAASRFPRPAAVSAAAVLLAAVLAPAACSAVAPASAMAPTPAVAPASATPPVPVLRWRSCDGGFQCATARVPLSYRDPRGAMISIAVIRHLATDPARRAGTLFFNLGGPMEQVLSFATGGFGELPAAIRARYDVISFDPRGFGYSTAVRCFPTMAAESKFLGGAVFGGFTGLPVFPVGARQEAAFERTWARFDARCAQRNGSLLDHDTTADVARDMNLLREAVGAPALNYLGVSYGTELGATYANLFPATTAHMILDANVNPVAWTRADGILPTFLGQGTDQASAATMRAFLDLCGKTTTSACAFSAGTPAATRAKWAMLLRRLCRHPVTIGTPPQTYTYADAVVSVPLVAVSQWQSGASVLQQLWLASTAGRQSTAATPATRAQASPPATAATLPPGFYTGWEQTLAVLCPDSPNPRDPAAYSAAGRRAYARSGAFGLEQPWKTEACADWPAADAAQDRYSGPWNRPTATTILVIGNTGDPVLPLQNSVAMSRDLAHARLLTVDGYGHTELGNPSTCATDYETRYLLTGALPPPRTVCEENATPFSGGGQPKADRPPRHDASARGCGEAVRVAAMQGGAGDEPFAEEMHSSATPAVPRLTAGMIG
jgi:pimeloyl-ACP methyl ester carboxylesterase